MGTKTTTTQQAQYQPQSMQAYQSMLPQWLQGLQSYAQNPLASSMFQQRQQISGKEAAQSGQTAMSNLAQNLAAGGFSGGNLPGFAAQQLGNIGRGVSAQQAQGTLANLLAAQQAQQWALGSMEAYNPLQTGQTATQQTSGLGTWLPQVAGMALGAAMGIPGMPSWLQAGSQGVHGLPSGMSTTPSMPMGLAGTGVYGGMYGMPSGMPSIFSGIGSAPPTINPLIGGG